MEKKKILLIAMPSLHLDRWVSHIDRSKYKLYWFNILEMPHNSNEAFALIFENWKKRKVKPINGEYFLSKKLPSVHKKIRSLFEVTEEEYLKKIIKDINPDIIHTFEMQSCTYPIGNVLKKLKIIRIYSCWGSDLFFYRNIELHRKKIVKILKHLDVIHTDNKRDIKVAQDLGFKGSFTPVIPGGGGYDLKIINDLFTPIENRKIILIKGYEHKMGRAINILKALEKINDIDKNFEIVVFGAFPKLTDYLKSSHIEVKVFLIKKLTHLELLKLMGKSYIYIGNSVSDGMPNTLIEAFLLGAFPIQSNPGGVAAELINNKENGCLINDPNNIDDIKKSIEWSINNRINLHKQILNNQQFAYNKFNFETLKLKINQIYQVD
jgi:glycosyltransferase involved in cell wall biosynthesis